MKILIVGSGGREHAITWRLAQDETKHELYCAPGNAGTAALATNLAIGAEDVAAVAAWAESNRPDLVVVGPEAPLCKGLVDALEKIGVKAFGPVAAGARMEGSKRFAKEVMDAAGVPTGRARTFTDAAAAKAALAEYGLPVVIKADGLAAGKGVVVAETTEQAEAAIDDMLVGNKFGAAGAEVLVEEFLHGEECSILALVDGERAVLLPSSQDHKRVFDGDKGPNTGGMGAYSPAPVVTDAMLPEIKEKIILPVVHELKKRGITYRGVLYAGLMVTPPGGKTALSGSAVKREGQGDHGTRRGGAGARCDSVPLRHEGVGRKDPHVGRTRPLRDGHGAHVARGCGHRLRGSGSHRLRQGVLPQGHRAPSLRTRIMGSANRETTFR